MLPSPPPACRECDPGFVSPPTVRSFHLENKRRPLTNFIRADITRRDYLSYHVRNESLDRLGCPGRWLFGVAWNHFVRNEVVVLGIVGEWSFGSNLATVNRLTRQAISLEGAIRSTWAYGVARDVGFTSIDVIGYDGTDGGYKSVDLLFLP